MKRLTLAALAAFCLFPSFSPACSICGCGDPLAAAGESLPASGSFSFNLDGEALTAKAASDDDPFRTESLVQQTVRVGSAYSPTDSLTLVATLPWVRKQWSASGGEDPDASAEVSGLGDMEVAVRWFFARHTNLRQRTSGGAALSFGSSLPTGGTDFQAGGARLDQHAQLGAGAWGPYVGLYGIGEWEDWTFSSNAYLRSHGTNAQGYAYGTAFTWGAEARRLVGDRWAAALALEGRFAWHDLSDGLSQGNTGGAVLDLSPSVWLRLVEDAWLGMKVQVPAFQGLFGEQTLGPTAVVSLRWQV